MAENTSVDTFDESVQDDAAQAHEETNRSTPISDFLDAASEGENTPQDEEEHRENGGIRGRLLASENKGYSRGKSEAEAAWQAEKAQYEARIRDLEEYEIKEQARELAKQENVSEALAERLIRAERGRPSAQAGTQPQEQKPSQPRDAQGRFVSQQQNDVNAYASELVAQAETVKRLTGIDMIALYNSDPDVQARVAGREIDFYGLAEEMRGNKSRSMPPVVRSANGQAVRHRSIADLSDAQFDELDRRIEQGAVFDMRR